MPIEVIQALAGLNPSHCTELKSRRHISFGRPLSWMSATTTTSSSSTSIQHAPVEIQVTRDTYSSEEELSPPVYAQGTFYRPLVSPLLPAPDSSNGPVHNTSPQLIETTSNHEAHSNPSKADRSRVFLKLRRKLKLSNLKRSFSSSDNATREVELHAAGTHGYVVADDATLNGLPPVLRCGDLVYMPVDPTIHITDDDDNLLFSTLNSPMPMTAAGPQVYRSEEFDAELPSYEESDTSSPLFVRTLRKWMRKLRTARIFLHEDGTVDWAEIAGLVGAVAVVGILIIASVVFVLVML